MNKNTLITILVIIILVLGSYVLFKKTKSSENPNNNPPTNNQEEPAPQGIPNLIIITTPKSGGAVTSPLTVTGQARGNWYFEASFPIKIYDANDILLETAIAQAQGDWMTTEFVPFSAKINFIKPNTEAGYIVFEKDNPSGLPEFDNQFKMPIKF